MAVRILQSKIQMPRPDPSRVVRPRLLDRLRTSAAPVWLLSAPAGCGKTTLAADAVDDLDARVAWVNVDSADNDPVRFWSHVTVAVHGDDTTDGLLDRISPETLDGAVDELVTFVERQSGRVVLALDDIHLLTETEPLAGLTRLINRPPANLTVALVTRTDPALAVGRLRAFGRVTEIRASDLAFDRTEALQLLGESVTRTERLQRLLDATGGWATVLRLIALSTDPDTAIERAIDPTRGPAKDISGFFADEALGVVDETLRSFLIETSALAHLTPEVCDLVTDSTDSLSTLRSLVDRQLFTDVIDEHSIAFRYHPVFRDVLRQQFDELAPDRRREIHQIAADWHVARGEPDDAIRHALLAQNESLAFNTLKAHYVDYAHRGQIATVNDWLTRFGIDRCRRDNELRMLAAWAALNRLAFDEADDWLITPDGVVEVPWVTVQELTIRSHCARHLGDSTLALTLASNAVDLLRTGVEAEFPSSALAALSVARFLETGEIDGGLVDEMLAIAERDGDEPSLVLGQSLQALRALEQEDLAGAYSSANRACSYVTTPELERFHQPTLAYIALSRIGILSGRPADAQSAADRAAEISESGHEPLLAVLAACAQARAAHQQGHQSDVRAALRSAEASLDLCESKALEKEIRSARNDTRFARPTDQPTVEDLSDREYAVLQLLPLGLTRKELGEQLFVSENTIKSYLTMLRNKLGVRGDRKALLHRARELGLLATPNIENDTPS